MKVLLRWCRFNLVGAAGTVVQLTALAAFNRLAPSHYLLASVAAIEVTLLHNFVFHLHYTWRDRCTSAAIPGQLIRFHLSNGLVSIGGNLLLMPLLVERAGLPLLPSNGIAIVCCSLINFLLANRWAFPAAL